MRKIFYSIPEHNSLVEWLKWEKETKKKYPIQFFIREELPSLFRKKIVYKVNNFYWYLHNLFFPNNKYVRNSIPREYTDSSELIIKVNFAIIKSFKEEADKSLVDWDSTVSSKEFKSWLNDSYEWIVSLREKMLKESVESYPDAPLEILSEGRSDFESLYSRSNSIEKLIQDTDNQILINLVKYRNFMWT